jgi:ATP phosphoribosyltransferase regulatory subunit
MLPPPTSETQSARWIEALDQQAAIIMGVFARAGFEPIAPPIIQPADVFLDLIGEELRARTYVFTDPDGAELCLRPDLTIPACRHYLACAGRTAAGARYAYNGVIFRYQPASGDLARPREFRQAGIESFAAADPAKAEAEIVALTVEAVRAAGLGAFKLRLGDLGLVNALLDAIEMPERWRRRLRHHFWRPDAFRRDLARLARPADAARGLSKALIDALEPERPEAAEAVVLRHLEAEGLAVAGTRTVTELAERLLDIAADARATPLPARSAHLLEAFLGVAAPAKGAATALRKLLGSYGLDLSAALEAFDRRLALVAEEGVDVSGAELSAGFGRSFEYYTGFVFELVAPGLGEAAPIAGGGRYDGLLPAMGLERRVAAVGSAIHTERLLLAVRGGRP